MDIEMDATTSAEHQSEVSLQLALDHTSLHEALELVDSVAPHLVRVEIGTPLVLARGFDTIRQVASRAPRVESVVADVKICDAGEKIARAAYAAGADVITAVTSAIDDVTWRGILRAANDRLDVRSRAAPVLLDTIGPAIDLDRLGRFSALAQEADVRVELCIHRPKSGSGTFTELINPILDSGPGFDQIVIAGGLSPADVRPALDAGFRTLIVGGAISGAPDPVAAWDAFRHQIDLYGPAER